MTLIIQPNDEGLNQACQILQYGGVIGMPTETVYGLAADAFNDRAIASIFSIKNRPHFNPLIVHIGDLEQLNELVELNSMAQTLIDSFWPGPLTLVLNRKNNSPLSMLVSGGLDTVAIRMPAHPVALKLCRLYKNPIAAPSANKFMSISPTQAQDVALGLKDQIPLVIDGGACSIGLESTIIDLSVNAPTLLRPGGVSMEALEKIIGPVQSIAQDQNPKIKAPGMFKRHYAPSKDVRLNAVDCKPGEVYLGFGNQMPISQNPDHLNLSETASLKEAAANLFRFLRILDLNPNYHTIAIAPIPIEGLGLAINDRITRASSKEFENH